MPRIVKGVTRRRNIMLLPQEKFAGVLVWYEKISEERLVYHAVDIDVNELEELNKLKSTASDVHYLNRYIFIQFDIEAIGANFFDNDFCNMGPVRLHEAAIAKNDELVETVKAVHPGVKIFEHIRWRY